MDGGFLIRPPAPSESGRTARRRAGGRYPQTLGQRSADLNDEKSSQPSYDLPAQPNIAASLGPAGHPPALGQRSAGLEEGTLAHRRTISRRDPRDPTTAGWWVRPSVCVMHLVARSAPGVRPSMHRPRPCAGRRWHCRPPAPCVPPSAQQQRHNGRAHIRTTAGPRRGAQHSHAAWCGQPHMV